VITKDKKVYCVRIVNTILISSGRKAIPEILHGILQRKTLQVWMFLQAA